MKTIFFDIDTQIDFVFPAGSLYVPGSEDILPLVAKLNHYAAANGIVVVSTMDAHTENDPEFRRWPHHCVAGSLGQRKPEQTLLPSRVVVPSKAGGSAMVMSPQVLLEKQTLDCFSNPNLTVLLDLWNADRYVVYGVVAEICVNIAAFGLLKTGKRVEIVSDAIRALDSEAAESMMREFRAGGGEVVTSEVILQG